MLTALSCGTPEQMKKDIERIRTLTKKPFAVNLTILPAIVPPDYEAFAQGIIDAGVKIVETAGSNPKLWVSKFKAAGIISIHKCVTIRHALSAERLGVDIVSLDSFECAGQYVRNSNSTPVYAPNPTQRTLTFHFMRAPSTLVPARTTLEPWCFSPRAPRC